MAGWPPVGGGGVAAHSAYDVFRGVGAWLLVWFFSHLGFWGGNLFLIAPFPDLCLLVPFQTFKKLARQNICYIESITITIQEPKMYRKICIFVLFGLVSETLLHSYLEYICIM